MRSQYKHARVARGAIGLGVVLAVSSAVGGCVYVDESGQLAGPEQFCGYLYACGSDSDTNRGGQQTATGTSSDSSSTSSSSTGGESTTGGE
jgi:hypothetical protein